MFVVGVTGGIGSGKTAVTNLFAELGITIVDADIASRIIVEPGKPALAEIAERFGADMLQVDGTLDRAAMRKRIFANPDDRRALECITHPRIGEEIRKQLREAESPYAILVSPLLIEGDQHELCDRILVVDVPESVQLQRTMQRDSNDAEQVKRIIASQASREQRLSRADDVIENTGTLDDLRAQVAALHQQYLLLGQAAVES
jgi:dephospho-CoA kinase